MDIKGYTLLEVSLFLAISGGLTLVAIVGLAPRLTNVRFTSAMRGLHENVTKEMSISELGHNNLAGKYECSAPGGNFNITFGNSSSSSCVFVGRLAVFNSGRVDYRSIAALRTTVGCSQPKYSYEALTRCNLATVIPAISTNYDYSNGIKTGPSVPAVYGYGYVKSPDNNSTYRFILQNPSSSLFQLKDVTPLPAGANPKVCYQLSNRRAHLELSATRAEPTLVFGGVCP